MIAAREETVSAPIEPLARRIEALAAFPPGVMEALRESLAGLGLRARSVPPRTGLAGAEGPAGAPLLVGAGWGARQRILADGRRQILGFVLPGDVIGVDPHRAPLRYAATVSLTAMVVADAEPLRTMGLALPSRDAPLARAMRALAAAEEALLSHQVTRLGRQTAYERVGHLFLELRERLCLAGVEQGDSFTLPVTQEILADTLGLSIVHTNRTIQQLRRDGLVSITGTQVTLVEPKSLAGLTDYVPLATMLGRS
ncbi:Crp/Fnr family transcriptional regulator [Methylobacterium durans]|uniref:Crp/Fnr family transcriptional regulator n=1 Tax=Methylobacterium durans TaxID=2202825 RepID=UPI002AFE07F0|nr:Crp/Fnr family transcriptional regulator [Methylobacterium durans]MEA1834060.1 Crp/Fnr family transcriptional regulator [Methylobacterium durans]